jgi:hypothetical protein
MITPFYYVQKIIGWDQPITRILKLSYLVVSLFGACRVEQFIYYQHVTNMCSSLGLK